MGAAKAGFVRNAGALLLLAALVGLAFGGAVRGGFVQFDDDLYVTENPWVREGLTLSGLRWACTTRHAANWHPLTWLSHMADAELYGLQPAGHHLTSLLLHALNAGLLFLVLRSATGRAGLALLAAALWAVHPLRVESTVWIAERKDVLAALFGLLALWLHVRRRSGWTLAAFGLSLLAKPTWVTLPFLLLLFDVWPLRRWPAEPAWKWVRGKWPLFLLAAAASVVTYGVQQAGGALLPGAAYPWGVRLANAALAYGHYLRALFVPMDLMFFRPHPGLGVSAGAAWGVGLLLGGLTAAALAAVRRWPWWTTGWLWFIGALVPMIGLVPVGGAAWADRYTYLPHIGLVTALVWGAAAGADALQGRWLVRLGGLLGWGLVAGLVVLSQRQTAVWRDSEALFRHALAIREDNAVAHGNLGAWLATQGRIGEARQHLERSLEIQPGRNAAHFNLGTLALAEGRPAEAIRHYRAMVAANPRHAAALNNLAFLLATDPAATPAQAAEALELAQRAVQAAVRPDPALLDTLAKAQQAAQKPAP